MRPALRVLVALALLMPLVPVPAFEAAAAGKCYDFLHHLDPGSRTASPAGDPYAIRYLRGCDLDRVRVVIAATGKEVPASMHWIPMEDTPEHDLTLLEVRFSFAPTTPIGKVDVRVILERYSPSMLSTLYLTVEVTRQPVRGQGTATTPPVPGAGLDEPVGTFHDGGTACLTVAGLLVRCLFPDPDGTVPDQTLTPYYPGAASGYRVGLAWSTRAGGPDTRSHFQTQYAEYTATLTVHDGAREKRVWVAPGRATEMVA